MPEFENAFFKWNSTHPLPLSMHREGCRPKEDGVSRNENYTRLITLYKEHLKYVQ
jgi:hypothetical protein